MKKILSCVFVMAMILSMLSIGGFTFSIPAATFTLADVDSDGSVTTNDARRLLKYIVHGEELTAIEKLAADVNTDGAISTSDVRAVLNIIVNGGSAGTTLTEVDLLAPTAESWYCPAQTVYGTACSVTETALSDGGYILKNSGGNWPFTSYSYGSKILLPDNAVIQYDLTINSDSVSLEMYTGGYQPVTDDSNNPVLFKLNSYISDNLDATSGDLLAGTYTGSIAVSDLDVEQASLYDGMLWLSGIKIYVVGNSGSSVTIRKLTAIVYEDSSSDQDEEEEDPALTAVRSSLINSSEMTGLSSADLTAMELYVNGARSTATSISTSNDNKKIYHTASVQRVVNYPDGYQVDLPPDWKPDYSLSALRSCYSSAMYDLSISKEQESPYSNTSSGWQTYLTEWLNLYIADESYLAANDMAYTRTPTTSQSILSGYTVMTYDIVINNPGETAMPYYSIAIIRKFNTYKTFFLMVLKSSEPTESMIDQLVGSFKEITVKGTAVNSQGQYEQIVPSTWNAETRAYYDKLCTQDSTDFGFFSASMVSGEDGSYSSQYNTIVSEYDRLSEATGGAYDILPTYTHLLYDTYLNNFPLKMAKELAGGNGYNGKPVLQFTYQFTSSNNQSLSGYTPIFDVMRGVYDDQFRVIARDIKKYGKPILFRLNNEMNTDWTSYAGLLTLLDPDIFIITWQRMYDIFQEEGVDNCIWIFNPFTPTAPYCSWGEALCYMPGAEYVQILGLTDYEMGNDTTVPSFKSMYTEVYNDNKDYFINYPWVISEFACGAGGEKAYDWNYDTWTSTTLGRNGSLQASWVTGMFDVLNNRNASGNEFCRNIKGAVWFSVNDYTYINGEEYVLNYLELDSTRTATLEAFKAGLNP